MNQVRKQQLVSQKINLKELLEQKKLKHQRLIARAKDPRIPLEDKLKMVDQIIENIETINKLDNA